MRIQVSCEEDIHEAVQYSLRASAQLGFNKTMRAMIATAVSELTRNMHIHGRGGVVTVTEIENKGIEVCAEDDGPGIENIDKAMEDHYSTVGSLGIGLPGTKRLMDEFELESEVGKGTKIVVRKWLRSAIK